MDGHIAMTGPAAESFRGSFDWGDFGVTRERRGRVARLPAEPRRKRSASARCSGAQRHWWWSTRCAVTAEAVRQTRQAIRRARRARPDARLLVTGCAAEIERAALARDARGRWADRPTPPSSIRARGTCATPRSAPAPPRTPAPSSRSRTAATMPAPSASSRRAAGRAGRCRSPQVLRESSATWSRGAAEVVLTGVDLTSWGARPAGAAAARRAGRGDPRRLPALRPPAPVLARRDRDRSAAVRTARRRAAGDAARPPLAAARATT